MIVFVMKAGGEEEEDRIGARNAEMRGPTPRAKKKRTLVGILTMGDIRILVPNS